MGQPLNIAFRTDAGYEIGHGHLVRCLTLARILRESGARVTFVCRPLDGLPRGLIEDSGFSLVYLPIRRDAAESVRNGLPEALDWSEDARLTVGALRGTHQQLDWLVVDHYELEKRWERELRQLAARILVIDDLADREHDCDVLLDQNLLENMEQRYHDKLPPDAIALLGPQYALLQPDYRRLHVEAPVRRGPVRRIFVFFGGADIHDLTGRTLAALSQIEGKSLTADVAISAGNPHAEAIRKAAERDDRVTVHVGLPSLAELMFRADLAVGAAGTATWERLCMGLPAVVVTIAGNQTAVARELQRRGLIRWLGSSDDVDQESLLLALREAVTRGLDDDCSRRCLETVDGRGADRVATVLLLDADSPLVVRPAVLSDEELVLQWANDPLTRASGFNPNLIDANTHRSWFRRRLENPDENHFYILETDRAVPVGQVRFEKWEGKWELHYLVAPAFRRRGLGRRLLQHALPELSRTGVDRVFARVKNGNTPSCRIFERLGFERQPNLDAEVIVYGKDL